MCFKLNYNINFKLCYKFIFINHFIAKLFSVEWKFVLNYYYLNCRNYTYHTHTHTPHKYMFPYICQFQTSTKWDEIKLNSILAEHLYYIILYYCHMFLCPARRPLHSQAHRMTAAIQPAGRSTVQTAKTQCILATC